MSDRRSDDDLPFEALSALSDGEASAAEVARACAAWRDDAKVRAQWSSYHVIGDVMRSDELANASGSSARFLKSFRERLAEEPVVLAPAGLVARHQPSVVDVGLSTQAATQPLRRRVWAGPMAVAACFVMVVGALVTNQGGLGGASVPDGSLAQGTVPTLGATAQAFVPSSSTASWSGNGVTAASLAEGASFTQGERDPASSARVAVWRDPQLDQALSAHRAQPGELSFAGHGGLVRNVLYETP
jgi:sigma-E factor negative regulatory protein RseA